MRHESAPAEEIDVRRGRRSLLALFGVALLPVFIAAAMYFLGVGIPEGRTNQGELITPVVEVAGLQWMLADGNDPLPLGPESGWKVVYPGEVDCEQACRDWLLHARQTRIALGRETNRVDLYYLLPTSSPTDRLRDWVGENMQGLTFLSCSENTPACGLPAPAAGQQYVYLVDPLGNVILRYGSGGHPRALLEDLKRLLKVSRVG